MDEHATDVAAGSDELWQALRDEEGPVRRADDRSHREVAHPLLATLGRDVRELQRSLAAVDATDRHHGDPEAPATMLGWLQDDLRGARSRVGVQAHQEHTGREPAGRRRAVAGDDPDRCRVGDGEVLRPDERHGRGGAGNINPDDTKYVDGSIVRQGDEGSHGDGAYSTGRGGMFFIFFPYLTFFLPPSPFFPFPFLFKTTNIP